MLQNLHVSLFWQGAEPIAPARRNDAPTSKIWERVVFYILLRNVFRTTKPCKFSTSDFQKWPETASFSHFWLRNVLRTISVLGAWGGFGTLTSRCASCHKGVCTFWTSQLPKGLDVQMCFAPQQRALSTSQLPKVLRHWGVLRSLTSASRHNRMHFFISHLRRWLRTHRFSAPTFRPSLLLPFFSLALPTSAAYIVGSLTSKLPLVNGMKVSVLSWG